MISESAGGFTWATGVLQACLDYAAKAAEPLPGIYAAVRKEFSSFAATGLPQQVKEVYASRTRTSRIRSRN